MGEIPQPPLPHERNVPYFHKERSSTPDFLYSAEMARVGNVPMIVGGFGDVYESKEEFIQTVPADFPDREENIRIIEGLGFAGGYKNRAELGPTDDEFFERMGQIGAHAVEAVMAERGWDGADIVVLSSASANIMAEELMLDLLQSQGIEINTSYLLGQACNTTASAVNDLCRLDAAYNGTRAVVVAIENLSGTIVDPEEYVTRFTFGNVYGAMAFQPGVDINHVMGHDTVIEKDTQGVIRIPRELAVEQKGDIGPKVQRRLPWYQFEGEVADDFFYTNAEGSFLNLPIADTLTMDGVQTALYFSPRVSAMEADTLLSYYTEYFGRKTNHVMLGELGPTVAQQPSLAVHLNKMKKVERLIRKAKREDQTLPDFPVPEAPWVMEQAGLNNGSAATIFVPFVHMAKRGDIQPNRPFLMEGYGAGSAISANVMYFS